MLQENYQRKPFKAIVQHPKPFHWAFQNSLPIISLFSGYTFILFYWKPGSEVTVSLRLFPKVLFSPTALTSMDLEKKESSLSLSTTFRPLFFPFAKHPQPWLSSCYLISPSVLYYDICLLPPRSGSLIPDEVYSWLIITLSKTIQCLTILVSM